MGATAAFCTFDTDRYRTEVVAALRAGASHPNVQAASARIQRFPARPRCSFERLDEVMSHFDAALRRPSFEQFVAGPEGVLLEATDAPGPGVWGYDQLVDLFEDLVTHHCISHLAVVGRTYRPEFALLRGADGVGDSLRTHVEAIGQDGRYWAHGSGGYGEGISGWIDAGATAEFAAAMAAVQPSRALHEEDNTPDTLDASLEAHAARLEVSRRLLAVAVAQGHGTLWGIDLHAIYQPPAHIVVLPRQR